APRVLVVPHFKRSHSRLPRGGGLGKTCLWNRGSGLAVFDRAPGMTNFLRMTPSSIESVPPGRLYGRRRARPRRPGQQRLKQELLPRLAIRLPERGPVDPHALFAKPVKEVRLEIGFGAGEHLAEQAERHPNVGFIGSEVFEDGIVRALGEVSR